MRCGKILVEGEAEELAALPSLRTSFRRPRRQQSRNKKDGKVKGSNPYATRGLEKFATLNEELAAKRISVARKTGSPEDLVRFCYSTKGWVPVLVKGPKSGEGDPRVSILGPPRTTRKDGGCEEIKSGCGKKDDGCEEIEKGCQNHETGSIQPVVPWCGYLRTTAFGVLTVSALMARKSVVPAAAMAVVMVVYALQKRWIGGVMSMKKFVMSGISYFSGLIVHWKIQQVEKKPEKIVEKKPEKMVEKEPEKIVETQIQIRPENVIKAVEIKKRPRGCLSLSPSLLRDKNDNHESTIKEGATKSNKKKYARIVSMDGQPRKPIRSDYHKSESFNRRRFKNSGVGPTVGASVMIIVLFCLVFYGRICAIFVTSAWWYLLPKFRTEVKNSENGDLSKMDLKLRELRKKKVIMDGLLDRSHNNINIGRPSCGW